MGDRLLTDVVFGNLHGMLTVHTQPLTLKGDNRPAAVFRFLERKVRSRDDPPEEAVARREVPCLVCMEDRAEETTELNCDNPCRHFFSLQRQDAASGGPFGKPWCSACRVLIS